MTLIAVPILVETPGDAPEAVARAERATRRGAALVEWRVDPLVEDHGREEAVAVVRRLIADAPLPAILTCRSAAEGGRFLGAAGDLSDFLGSLADAEIAPRYLDVEFAVHRAHEGVRAAAARLLGDGDGGLILSTHDFDGRPADLLQRVAAMVDEPACRIAKIAWRARSLRDNLEAFDLLAERRGPTIALCMGPFGLPSRVLPAKFGGFLTFAADEDDGATAPGQPTIDALRETHRFDVVGPRTRLYGVVGWPVEHSRSPALHNAAFAAAGHDAVYLPLPVPPEWEHFKATVGAFVDHPRLGFSGASVTLPHKAHLVRFVRERGGTLDAASAAIGAANTLVVRRRDDGAVEGLEARNTDAPAARETLCAGMEIDASALRGRRVALFGAGGAARAVASALIDADASVVVFNRSAERAEALVRDLGGGAGGRHLAAAPLDAFGDEVFEVIVNCTSVGMDGGPAPDESPLPRGATIGPATTVFDTVYAPPCTPLLARAAAAGARAIGGIGMLRRQAALQFEAWTGEPAPAEVYETT